MSVVGNSEKDHCKNACQDEKSGKHRCCSKQKSLEPVELSTGDHHIVDSPPKISLGGRRTGCRDCDHA